VCVHALSAQLEHIEVPDMNNVRVVTTVHTTTTICKVELRKWSVFMEEGVQLERSRMRTAEHVHNAPGLSCASSTSRESGSRVQQVELAEKLE